LIVRQLNRRGRLGLRPHDQSAGQCADRAGATEPDRAAKPPARSGRL